MPKFILGVAMKSGSVKNAVNELKKLQDGISRVDKQSEQLDKAFISNLQNLKKLASVGGSFAAFRLLYRLIKESVLEFAKFESGLVAIQRIAGLSESEINNLGKSISALSAATGIATSDIIKFAETGARFGLIGEELEDFTRTISRFAAVSGGVTEATQQQFAKLKEITDSTAVSFGGLANAVVNLGQSFPTTEAKITRTANRVAQDLAEFQVSTQFVLGLGTAIEATGLGAERASTAFAQVTRSLQKLERAVDDKSVRNFEELADAVNITSDALRDLIVEDPAQAIVSILESGAPTATVLEKLGETGTRTAGSFATLSTNSDVLRKALELAGREISDTDDLIAQQAKQLDTLEGQWNRAGAAIDVFLRKLGGDLEPAAKGVLEIFNEFADLFQDDIDFERTSGLPNAETTRAIAKFQKNQAAEAKRVRRQAEREERALADRTLKFIEDQKKLQDDYNASVKATQDSIDKLRESETDIGRLRGLEGVEKDLESVRIKYDKLRESFDQRYDTEYDQLTAAGATEDQIKAFGDRWKEFFDDFKGFYRDALIDAGENALDSLKDQLDGLREEYQDIVDRENEQRREFNQRQEGQVGATSLIEAAQFDIERAELERNRAEEIKERRKEHAENRKDAKAIKDEIVDVQEEIKKASATGATGTVSATK